MKRRMVFGTFLLMWCTAAAACAGEVALTPSKDNTLFEQTNANSQTSNALGDIFVGRSNQASSSIRRGLVQFDIAGSLPNWATVTGVSLELRETTAMNVDQTVNLHRLLENWGEGTSSSSGGAGAAATPGDATWLYAFYATAAPDRLRGRRQAVCSCRRPAQPPRWSMTLRAAHVFSWSSAGMVADVQGWLDNPSTNFGWALVGNESAQQTAKRFNGGEALSPAVSPVLRVTFVPEPTTAVLMGVLGAALLMFRIGRR